MRPFRPWSMLKGEEGAIAPLAAMTLAGMVGLGGLVTDIGVWYVKRGELQAATDSAALAAANRPADASSLGGTLLAQNGFAAANLVSSEAGYYCANAGLSPSARFSSSPCATGDVTPTTPNAVRLTAQTTGPALLTKVLGGTGRTIKTTAIAARVDEAGLAAGTGLANIDLPLLNAVLQSLLGGSGLNLSAVQFNGLLSTNVAAKDFLDALATETGVSGGTYGQLLQSSMKVTDVLQAGIDALNAQAPVADVSGAVSGLQAIKSKVTGNAVIQLGQLFDLGIWRDAPVAGSTGPAALGAGLNVLQVATFALQLGGAQHAVTVPTSGLSIPGLVGATVQATAIEPPQSAYYAFGPKGISVHTAQVRLQLALQVLGSTIQVPLYVEAAHGDATLTDLGCGTDPAVDGWAKVSAKTGVASVYIGQVNASAMNNFSSPVTVSPAPLINVTLGVLGSVQVGAMVPITAGSSTATTLTFTQPPSSGIPQNASVTTSGYIARLASVDGGPSASAGWPAQVVSADILSGVGTGLATGLKTATFKTCVLTACTTNLSSVFNSTVVSALSPVLTILLNIDPLIDQLLEALGVQLGTTQVMVTGLRCGVPVLVG